jgi:NAD(P)-dependent dehydrogenase (short-subunit alcohol dehydrogenase family)
MHQSIPLQISPLQKAIPGNTHFSGLGALVCEKFAAKGCNIAINYHSRAEPAEQLAAKIRSEYRVKTVVLQGDAGELKDCRALVQETRKEFGGLDVIVGNAVCEQVSLRWLL